MNKFYQWCNYWMDKGLRIAGQFKFRTEVPKLHHYIGRRVNIPGVVNPVTIIQIVGNVGRSLRGKSPKPQYYEINGQHLISMLRFHAQMEGDRSISEDQFRAFEEMEFSAEKLPEKKMAGQL